MRTRAEEDGQHLDPTHLLRERRADLELVRASLSEDRAAQKALLERLGCVPRFLASRNRRAGRPLDEDELLDVLQASLEIIWRKRASYRGEATLITWVWRIACLEWMSACRRRRQRTPVEAVAEPYTEAPTTLEDEEHAALLHAALARVDERDRGVLHMKHFEDLTFPQIARRLGVPTGTAKSWYYRGLELLRQRLHPMFEETPR